jgi:Na+-driven multidrug efflux pump
MASVEGGILRGQGRQHLGGIANVIVYWFIALPAGLALAFKADWGLYGLWGGMVRNADRSFLSVVIGIGTLCHYSGICVHSK